MPTQAPEVSVCIPTYNRARMLRESISSVLAQTFSDFELIVSDNASEDDTESLVRSFKDKRIRYARNRRNVGPRENMNRSLHLSRGKYIAFLPDDDLMMPENLRVKVAVLDASPQVGLVHSSYHLVDDSGRIVTANTNWGHGPDRTADCIEERRKLLTCAYNRINLPTVIFRRACYERLGGFTDGFAGEVGLAFDYEYWMRVALYYQIAFLARPLVKWRIHKGSLTSTQLAADGTRKLKQVLMAKRFLLIEHSRAISPDLEREIRMHIHEDVFTHAEGLIAGGGLKSGAGSFLAEVAGMFPDILLHQEAWKLLLKARMSRRSIERLKRMAPI
jgi:glycosyltransferase involved in cell wall biosynthesis